MTTAESTAYRSTGIAAPITNPAAAPMPWLGPAFALFNLCWAMSASVWGSHYFVDMLAGAAIGLAAFAATAPLAGVEGRGLRMA